MNQIVELCYIKYHWDGKIYSIDDIYLPKHAKADNIQLKNALIKPWLLNQVGN